MDLSVTAISFDQSLIYLRECVGLPEGCHVIKDSKEDSSQGGRGWDFASTLPTTTRENVALSGDIFAFHNQGERQEIAIST